MLVAIDLGTSTSEVAVLKNGKPQLIRDVPGSRQGILPSVVALGTKGELRVGQLAEDIAFLKPGLGVYEIKRLMGKPVRVPFGTEELSPQEVSAIILRHLKQAAEAYIGEPVAEAVITVPAYFNELQRQATVDAGELAGLKVRRLINEPTAAALAYGIERPGVEERILVYDLGGGTLDVTVLELSEGVVDVLASTGNDQLGGKDFDERLMQYVSDQAKKRLGQDLQSNPRRRLRLKTLCKKAKEELSSIESTTILWDNLDLTASGESLDFELEITRAQFETLIDDLIRSTERQIQEALAVRGMQPADIQTVLLVGGSTRVPAVRRFLSDHFDGRTLRSEVSPDEAVALGAAVLTGIEERLIDPSQMVVTDISNWTLGVAVIQDVNGQRLLDMFDPLILKHQTIPRTVKKTYTTVNDGQTSVRVRVYQGDEPHCMNNRFVGDLVHELIIPGPAGQEIEVEFSLNLSETLEIVVRDLDSGRVSKTALQPSKERMSDAEKATARARLDARWAGPDGPRPAPTRAGATAAPSTGSPSIEWRQGPLYEKVKALIRHAEGRLGDLEPSTRARVTAFLERIEAAVKQGDVSGLATAEHGLTDLLFELE